MTKNAAATKQDISDLHQNLQEEFKNGIRGAVDEISHVLDVMMERIDERFTRVETEQAKMRKEIQQILAGLDSIEKQLEISEDERLVMGHQLERLDRWLHELADHIGYKLPS